MNLQDVLDKSQKEADNDAANKGGSGKYLNEARLKIGEHKVRLFLDPEGEMFRKWKTKWYGKSNKADPRQFEECPESLSSRITNSLAAGFEHPNAKGKEFYKQDFWENIYAYMLLVETETKEDKYWKAGNLYCMSFPYYVRDAILSAISKSFSKDRYKEEMTESLDITKEGIVLEILIKKDKTCFVDVDTGGDKVAGVDITEYRENSFVPLSKFFTYNEEAGLHFADEISTVVDSFGDADDAITPPDEDGEGEVEETETETEVETETEDKAEKTEGKKKPF